MATPSKQLICDLDTSDLGVTPGYDEVQPTVQEDMGSIQSRPLSDGRSPISHLAPELFEMILHQLDMKDLLLSQRVSKKWQQAIQSSKLLQRQLFFLPSNRHEQICDCSDVNNPLHHPNNNLMTINPLLFGTLKPAVFAPGPPIKPHQAITRLRHHAQGRITLNPNTIQRYSRLSKRQPGCPKLKLHLLINLPHAKREWSCFRMLMISEPHHTCSLDLYVQEPSSRLADPLTLEILPFQAKTQHHLGKLQGSIKGYFRTADMLEMAIRNKRAIVTCVLTGVEE